MWAPSNERFFMQLSKGDSLDTERADTLCEISVVEAPHLGAVEQQVVDGQVDIGHRVILAAARTTEAVGARAVIRDQLEQPPLQYGLADCMLPPHVALHSS